MEWIGRDEALRLLGTKPQSLYASVSRGRVQARPDPANPRRSLYRRADVMRLARRGVGRRREEVVAAEAMRWGEPVLESGVSTVADGRLSYRGHDAVELAERVGLEEVAALLWAAPRPHFAVAGAGGGQPFLVHLFEAVARRAAADPPSFGRTPPALRQEAAGLMAVVAGAVGSAGGNAPLHRRLAAGWNCPEAADMLRRALVLLADHELNASTFAARIAASTGAPLAAAVLAGLATLTGPLHGSAAAALALLVPLAGSQGAEAAVGAWLAQGRPLPGFGHPLYPAGDARAAALLGAFTPPPAFIALAHAGEALTGAPPNIDFALAALAARFDLPPTAPLLLFALARSVGWLAHALEQAAHPGPIRPRARYVGPLPAGGQGAAPS